MNNTIIEQIAKNYLKSKNICFEAKNEKDECYLYIKKLDNIFYIECHSRYYQGELNPGDDGYPIQAEGFPCPVYKSFPSYRFVCDNSGNIIIDLAEIIARPYDRSVKWLDKENIFLPIKGDKDYFDNWQHFRIKNGEVNLINTFRFINDDDKNLLKNKLIIGDRKLYNFEKGIVVCDVFDGFLKNNENDLRVLATWWQIPSYSEQQEFIEIIAKKMKTENLLIGYKKVQVKKCNINLEYKTFMFIDTEGNFVSDLYYMDGYNFISVDNITSENFKLAIEYLNDNLISQIDAKLLEIEKKNQILHQIRKKLSL